MGSYDRMPKDYDGPAPQHMIWCDSKWSFKGLKHVHRTVAEVKACFEAARTEKLGTEVWPCSWLLEGRYDDSSAYTYECGLPTVYTDRRGSYRCIGGHDHVPAEVRYEQGWDYAADAGEAALLAKAGTRPVAMDGREWWEE